ncbi:MAG: hypothetical protein KDK01_15615, partial [Rhodobacteraceae bacterium]|nr:hypothetical protein [Paracoccaceae bacterium]
GGTSGSGGTGGTGGVEPDDGSGGDPSDGVIPSTADSAIVVVEYNDDDDDAFDDYIRIQADDVTDASDPQSYVDAVADYYAEQGMEFDTETEIKKLIFEDKDGTVVKVLYKTEDGFSETNPEDDQNDASDQGDENAQSLMIVMSDDELADMEAAAQAEAEADAEPVVA